MSNQPDNWDQIKSALADALELPAPERLPLLRARLGDDSPALREAEAMLAAYQHSDGVLDPRTDAWLGLDGPDLLALGGQRVGRYRLQKLLAEGAMAAVYLARQVSPDRVVALKLLRASLPLVDVGGRFKREASALGRLRHPNIAQIYEAGVHRAASLPGAGAAMPYIAMEFIDGLPITHFARQRGLDRRARVELLIKVARAVHAAHQQAVIHRDLKPANVLVDVASGEPKVLDFGIARIAGLEEDNLTWQTTAGVLLGTPGYMSPEQASGRIDQVDVRSDVWALGVLLHELLTDRLPVEVRDTSIAQALKRIELAEPAPIGRLDPTLRGDDLETVVATALEREKERRYPSAQALADDLQRVLQYEPITARPASRWYRVRKFVRRHRVGVAMTTGVALALVAATVVSTTALLQARRQRDLAVAAQARAGAVNAFLNDMLTSADTNVGGSHDLTVLAAIRAASRGIGERFASDPLAEAGVRETVGNTLYSLGQYNEARQHLERAVALYRQHLGPADRATLDATNYLATVYRWQYKPDDARALTDAAVPLAVARFGEHDPTTLALLDSAAGAAYDKGEYDTARQQYERLLALCRASPKVGPSHDMTFTTMNNLALVLGDAGAYADAERTLRELIDARAARQGMTSISQITARGNLAFVLNRTGRPEEARDLLIPLIEDARRVLGPTHDHTVSNMAALSTALSMLGRLDESLAIERQVVEAYATAYGPKDPRTARARGNYAGTLLLLDRAGEAEPILRETHQVIREHLGDDHLESFRTLNLHAKALQAVGRASEAEALWLDAHRRTRELFGEAHVEHLSACSNLAQLYVERMRPTDALTVLDRALPHAEQLDHTLLVAVLLRHRGAALTLLGDLPAAEAALLRSHALLSARSVDAIALARTREALVALYDRAGRPDDAQAFRPPSPQDSAKSNSRDTAR